MENLLKAQKSLEKAEESIAKHLSKESVEIAHSQFLSPLHPGNPDALYLLTIGRAAVRPLSSRVRSSHIKPAQNDSVCTRFPVVAHTVAMSQG